MNHPPITGMDEGEASCMPMVSSQESLHNDDDNFRPTETYHANASADDTHFSLEDCGNYLLSIPSVHAQAMQSTREYRELIRALHNLERAHERLASLQAANVPSFLHQPQTADEILHFILDFLDSQSLGRLASTCTRFRELVPIHARQRTRPFVQARQLTHPLQLVRAAEQVQGQYPVHPNVRIPTLLLSRSVVLRDAGDDDYNGTYHCTGSNGNGYVFTKPCTSALPLRAPASRSQDGGILDSANLLPIGYRLQCIISKRFSNETLLWYCCKEVLVTPSISSGDNSLASQDDNLNQADESGGNIINSSIATAAAPRPIVAQRYAFWARLTMMGVSSDEDLCRYPSQSSILQRQGDAGWQSLSNSRHYQAPTVELMD